MSEPTRRRELVVPAVLFFLSGATGLVFEVVFGRLLKHVFGSTAYATSTVLAAFMGGLALGAVVFGRVADRVRRPLLVYGFIELVVGAYVLVAPKLLDVLTGFYVDLHQRWDLDLSTVTLVRFVACFAVIFVPTCLMGATLPLLARHITRGRAGLGEHVSRLYAVNTFGAAFGTLLATFVLLEQLGAHGTLVAVALVDVGIFAVTLFVARDVAPEPSSAGPRAPRVPLPALLLVGAFLSGCLSFMYEVVFTHLLALLAGPSVYAFGSMLFVFLCGLAWGARIAARLLARGADAMQSFGLFQLAVAAVVVALLPVWPYVPWLYTAVGKLDPGFALRVGTQLVAVALVLLPPAVLLGVGFPLLLSVVARDRATLGDSVGRLLFANTLGAIAGATAAGFVLIPAIGAQDALRVLAGASLLLGLTFALPRLVASVRPRYAAGSFAIVAAAAFLPDWSARSLFSSQWLYFGGARTVERVLFQHEDTLGGFTTVIETREKDGRPKRTLLTNGKFEGNDAQEMDAQRAFAHVPMLLTPETGKALVVGLGTGVTVNEIARHPFDRIDVAELAPGIVRAAREHFAHVNGGVLDRDPRVRLLMNDGRNHLLLTEERYDLVTIEITSIYFAGAASLYSTDFFELVRDRLAPGGVLQQWVQFHHISRLDIARVIASMREVFPHVQLWVSGGQGLLTASMHRATFDYDRIVAAEGEAGDLLPLFGDLLLHGPALEDALEAVDAQPGVDEGDLLNTDDMPVLEYSSPRGYALRDAQPQNVAFFAGFRRPGLPPFTRALTAEEQARLAAAMEKRRADTAHHTR